jgi:FixJ family two-component response regulator
MVKFRARLLVIDDEEGIRNLLRNEFASQGYKVDACSNGEEGLHCIREEKYDVLITDIKMPGTIDGLQLLAAVKKLSPETEVIVITGFATVENAVLAMKEGAYDFIQKPFELDEMAILLEKALEKSELKAMLALYAGYRAVYSSFKLEELFPHMTSLLQKVVRADEIALLLRDYQQQFYLASASFSLVDHPFKDAFVSLAEQLCRSAADAREPVIMNADGSNALLPAAQAAAAGIQSLLLHPITLKEKNLGMLIIARTGGHEEFNAADQRNVSIFTALITQAIANSKLYEQLHVRISELENTRSRLEDIRRQLPLLAADAERGRSTAEQLGNLDAQLAVAIERLAAVPADDAAAAGTAIADVRRELQARCTT